MFVTTQEDREKVKQYITEASKAMMRKNDEDAHIKDILDTLKQDHDIAPKLARKAIGAMLKGNAAEVKEENDAFSDLYEIVGG